MVFSDYDAYDAVGLTELITTGEVTAGELVETAIDRIEQANPKVNAVISKHYERARRLAVEGDPGAPFHGVPFLTKDLATIAGDVVSFGSVFFRDYRPEVTDEYQHRVQRAGLISLGRTNSPEFGLLPTTESTLHGPTRNPWDLSRSAGGSSGGAAAAVAAGMVPMAHASDGGGSIRIPASSCGVFGMKTTRGRMPRAPESPSDYLSMDLAVSRSVRDVATLLDATHGAVPGSEYHVPSPDVSFASAVSEEPAPMRIAFATVDFRGKPTAADCVAGVDATAQLLVDHGHQVAADSPRVDGQSMAEAFLVIWEALAESIFHIVLTEAGKQTAGRILRRVLGDWRAMKAIAFLDKRKSGRDAFEPFTWQLAELSRRRTPAQLLAAHTELQRVSHQIGRFLEQYDLFLTPVLGSPPVELGSIDQEGDWDELVEQLFRYVAFTPIANFTGFPAMSVPVHWSAEGLPIGSHFMGRFGDERRMFSLAGQLERATSWPARRPVI